MSPDDMVGLLGVVLEGELVGEARTSAREDADAKVRFGMAFARGQGDGFLRGSLGHAEDLRGGVTGGGVAGHVPHHIGASALRPPRAPTRGADTALGTIAGSVVSSSDLRA